MEADTPHWTTYIALVAALASLLVSVLSYRKASSVKQLDLRLELRKAARQMHDDIETLRELIPYADRSRKANASAAGRLRSGFMQQWEVEIRESQDAVQHIADSAPSNKDDFKALSSGELEDKLVQIAGTLNTLAALRNRYKATMEEDRAEVHQKRELAHQRIQPQ